MRLSPFQREVRLVEEFRIPIIDSTIFPLFFNKQMEKAENF